MRVAQQVAAFLQAQGVGRVFGLCGGHVQPVWDAVDELGIGVVGVRHEMAAALMAQATAELSGGVGVASVTAGPGFTNSITGIANAYASRTPLLVLSGIPPRPQRGKGALQEMAQADIARPVTRYSESVGDPSRVLPALEVAWLAARDGRGPAYVDFPTDVLRAGAAGRPRHLPSAGRAFLDRVQLERARELLRISRRPVVISGRTAHYVASELDAFLRHTGALHLDTSESRGALPLDHPAHVPAVRARAMAEADLVVTVGRRLDFQLAYGSAAVFRAARFLRIGDSAEDTRDNRRGDAEVIGDVAAALEGLSVNPQSLDGDWIAALRTANAERAERLERDLRDARPGEDGRIHPNRVLAAVRSALPAGATVVADGGDILSFARVALQPRLDPGPMGCLGVGVPFGVAAALANGRPAIVVTGDGAFGLCAMELETAVRAHAPVLVVVANNAAWNIERHDQLATWNGRMVASELTDCRFDLVARGLGAHGERVEDVHALPAAFDRALANLPALIDVAVTRDAISADARNGLAWVPDNQPLAAWDEAEKTLSGQALNVEEHCMPGDC